MNSRNKSKKDRRSKSLLLKDIKPKIKGGRPDDKERGRSDVGEDSSYNERGRVAVQRKRQIHWPTADGEAKRVMTGGQLEGQKQDRTGRTRRRPGGRAHGEKHEQGRDEGTTE